MYQQSSTKLAGISDKSVLKFQQLLKMFTSSNRDKSIGKYYLHILLDKLVLRGSSNLIYI